MKKFLQNANDKKSRSSVSEKTSRSKISNNVHATAKKKASKLMSIFNYEYQESDLEQFVF